MEKTEIETYVSHEGTIRISGSTVPKKAGKCARHFLERGITPIDFFCIGANANQQATKAMGVFSYMTKNYDGLEIAFQPLRFMVETIDPTSQQKELKDAIVWRCVLLDLRK